MARLPQLCMSAGFFAATAILSLAPGPTFAQQPDATPEAEIGMHLFFSTGCGACHRIAGTAADGKIGPDLTHLASRGSIGAGLLPMAPENLGEWIRRTQDLKPGARMPSFGMLPVSETDAMVKYLVTLK